MVEIVQLRAHGGPETLVAARIDLASPGAGEVRIRHTAIGVNFVDVYHRTGLYPLASLPAVPGCEAAGVVEEIGPGVTGLCPGDRAAWMARPAPPFGGGYARSRLIAAEQLIRLPAGVPDEVAGSSLLRGLTAHMVFTRVAPVRPEQTVLIHAVAGGLGQVLAQWAGRLGARVIGTVGHPRKAAVAEALGVTVIAPHTDFVTETRRLTDGHGADTVIDGVGGRNLARSLDALRAFGTLVSIGQASGSFSELPLSELGRRSAALARPSVFTYCSDTATYQQAAAEVLAAFADGLQVTIGARFPLADAAAAHDAIESRQTTGSVVLIP